MRLIKRYPNRKLYDTAEKCYVTLSDIARLIRDGNDVQVMDHASGEDLTAITLTQIISEQEKRQSGFLPRAVLTGLIQAGGERLSTLRHALVSPLDMRHYVDAEIDKRLGTLALNGALEEAEVARLREKLLSGDAFATDTALKESAVTDLERVLAHYGVPSRKNIMELEGQLERLERKLDSLLKDSESGG